jgi:hypothetical protein
MTSKRTVKVLFCSGTTSTKNVLKSSYTLELTFSTTVRGHILKTYRHHQKSPPETQSPSSNPTTLTSSILQALSRSNVDSPVSPITMTNTTSPESDAVQKRKRLRMILTSAIALADSDDFDPTELSTTHQWLLQ